MSDNYLWDRSGEPDPELQELEEILGALQYQPRSLEIPSGLQVGRRRSLRPALAIAAGIALAAVALGFWFHYSHQQAAPALEAKHDVPVDHNVNAPQQSQTAQDNQGAEVV